MQVTESGGRSPSYSQVNTYLSQGLGLQGGAASGANLVKAVDIGQLTATMTVHGCDATASVLLQVATASQV